MLLDPAMLYKCTRLPQSFYSDREMMVSAEQPHRALTSQAYLRFFLEAPDAHRTKPPPPLMAAHPPGTVLAGSWDSLTLRTAHPQHLHPMHWNYLIHVFTGSAVGPFSRCKIYCL